MADYVTKSDLTIALDEGFNNIYKKLTKHSDVHFDKLEQDIAKLTKSMTTLSLLSIHF